MAQIVARLTPAEREAVMEGLDPEALLYDWSFWARPNQCPPKDDSWRVGLFLAGRGAGKTRSAAEWIREKAMENRYGETRFLLVARTAADLGSTIVGGDSGILAISPPSEMPVYNQSRNTLKWDNGALAVLRTAEEPDGLRGVQSHYSWGDEIAAWRQTPDKAGMTSWQNLRVATRLGKHPQIFATTTPKRVQLIKDLIATHESEMRETGKTSVWITRGSTMDNAGNLSLGYIEDMKGQFKGTHQERQELYGEMLDEQEGALWSDAQIEAAHDFPPLPHSAFTVIGVDPIVSENPRDECGIIVCASTTERELYRRKAWVLEDRSIKGKPEVWQREVVKAAQDYNAPIVIETNQGGGLLKQSLLAIDPTLRVFTVHAKHGKALRADRVIMPYEQNRVYHVDTFGDLETQMTTWDPEFTRDSPDRVDALVHALTALLVDPPKGLIGGVLESRSFASKKMNLGNVGNRNSRKGGSSRGGFRVRGFN